MVHRRVLILLAFICSGIQSCNVSDEIVPDIDIVLAKTFQIRIYANTGSTSGQIIDISSSEEYNDIKNKLDGFELTKITYRIKNDNVPEDMFFSGEIICTNDEENMDTRVGSISRINISEAAESKNEMDVTEDRTHINRVLGWLEQPGIFRLSSEYLLTNDLNSPYLVDHSVMGSNFELIIQFYIRVKTKV